MAVAKHTLEVILSANPSALVSGMTAGGKAVGTFTSGLTGGIDRFESITRGVKDVLEIMAVVQGGLAATTAEINSNYEQQLTTVKQLDAAIRQIPAAGGMIANLTTKPLIEGMQQAQAQVDKLHERLKFQKDAAEAAQAMKEVGDAIRQSAMMEGLQGQDKQAEEMVQKFVKLRKEVEKVRDTHLENLKAAEKEKELAEARTRLMIRDQQVAEKERALQAARDAQGAAGDISAVPKAQLALNIARDMATEIRSTIGSLIKQMGEIDKIKEEASRAIIEIEFARDQEQKRLDTVRQIDEMIDMALMLPGGGEGKKRTGGGSPRDMFAGAESVIPSRFGIRSQTFSASDPVTRNTDKTAKAAERTARAVEAILKQPNTAPSILNF